MTPLHLIDLGPPVEPEIIKSLVKSNWDGELVRGIMQTIRELAFESIEATKEGVKEQNPAWIHAQLGRHDACESIVKTFYELVEIKQPPQDS